MENNEQWKSGGDCNKCRKKNYCKKLCTMPEIMKNHPVLDEFLANIEY